MNAKFKIITYITCVALCLAIFVAAVVLPINAPDNAQCQYFCDRSCFSVYMDIDVRDENDNILYNINGEVLSSFDDDLIMKDDDGDIVRNTDDIYNLISQNNHTIYNGDQVLYQCNGQIKLLADSYEILDGDGNKIASVEFNMFDTIGIMQDNDGNVIARYDSSWFRYDYIVSIFDGCEIDDESILMIFASYVSDVRADS
jgi:uncharacterized protein YxjI